MACPLDYSCCCQTVTVYRREGDSIRRTVVPNCYLELEDVERDYLSGGRAERKFLLVMPGQPQRILPGDRIYDGIGPEVTLAQWPAFIPARIAGLVEAEYAKPFFWEGTLCHVEAGRKAPTW